MASIITNFEWTPDVWQRTDTRPVEDFVSMLLAEGNEPMTYRRLQARYYEWCECNELQPIRSWFRWRRAIDAAGIEKFRSSRPDRPWLYRVRATALGTLTALH